jgi:hypothetical protein
MKRNSHIAATRHAIGATAERIDDFRAQHLDISAREIMTENGVVSVMVNDSESPLAWLARRKGRDGRTMISPNQFVAGEKLRADFTRGQMTPRVTSNWAEPSGGRSRPQRRRGRDDRLDRRLAAARGTGNGSVRTGVFRLADGRVLLLARAGRRRARAWLADALCQARAAAGARPAGAALRSRQRWQRRCAYPHVACWGCDIQELGRYCEEPTGRADARPMTGSATEHQSFCARLLDCFARNDETENSRRRGECFAGVVSNALDHGA